MKKLILSLVLLSAAAQAQIAPLTVEKIMRDPKWMGTAPTNYRWSADSKTVFFSWNPESKERDQPYMVDVLTNKPVVTDEKNIEKAIGTNYTYNKDRTLGVYEKGGDIYFFNVKTKSELRLTNTVERETAARFLFNNEIVYQRGDNVFQLNLATNDLISIYTDASCLVYPSSYEGFGLPILEAMACSCPVISCNNSSIPEISGGAALLIDKPEYNVIKDAILKLNNEPLYRADLVLKGKVQAKKFSWEKTITSTAALYKTLITQY
ncbi:MAG: glycosyltransferase [Sphingobacteriales bacterium]|nr:MAG: glycosyltransferase [Sphingobacteriales bacterium]